MSLTMPYYLFCFNAQFSPPLQLRDAPGGIGVQTFPTDRVLDAACDCAAERRVDVLLLPSAFISSHGTHEAASKSKPLPLHRQLLNAVSSSTTVSSSDSGAGGSASLSASSGGNAVGSGSGAGGSGGSPGDVTAGSLGDPVADEQFGLVRKALRAPRPCLTAYLFDPHHLLYSAGRILVPVLEGSRMSEPALSFLKRIAPDADVTLLRVGAAQPATPMTGDAADGVVTVGKRHGKKQHRPKSMHVSSSSRMQPSAAAAAGGHLSDVSGSGVSGDEGAARGQVASAPSAPSSTAAAGDGAAWVDGDGLAEEYYPGDVAPAHASAAADSASSSTKERAAAAGRSRATRGTVTESELEEADEVEEEVGEDEEDDEEEEAAAGSDLDGGASSDGGYSGSQPGTASARSLRKTRSVSSASAGGGDVSGRTTPLIATASDGHHSTTERSQSAGQQQQLHRASTVAVGSVMRLRAHGSSADSTEVAHVTAGGAGDLRHAAVAGAAGLLRGGSARQPHHPHGLSILPSITESTESLNSVTGQALGQQLLRSGLVGANSADAAMAAASEAQQPTPVAEAEVGAETPPAAENAASGRSGGDSVQPSSAPRAVASSSSSSSSSGSDAAIAVGSEAALSAPESQHPEHQQQQHSNRPRAGSAPAVSLVTAAAGAAAGEAHHHSQQSHRHDFQDGAAQLEQVAISIVPPRAPSASASKPPAAIHVPAAVAQQLPVIPSYLRKRPNLREVFPSSKELCPAIGRMLEGSASGSFSLLLLGAQLDVPAESLVHPSHEAAVTAAQDACARRVAECMALAHSQRLAVLLVLPRSQRYPSGDGY